MNEWTGRDLEGSGRGLFEVLSRNLNWPREDEESHSHELGQLMTQLRFESSTFRMRYRALSGSKNA
jgi:hypothetical protein